MYQYRAWVIRVVDGDTLHLEVDLGFDIRRRDTFRLAGINAPENSTPEGKRATAWLTTRLEEVPTLIVTTTKDSREKYGRYLGRLWDGYGRSESINDEMIAAGHASEYPALKPPS